MCMCVLLLVGRETVCNKLNARKLNSIRFYRNCHCSLNQLLVTLPGKWKKSEKKAQHPKIWQFRCSSYKLKKKVISYLPRLSALLSLLVRRFIHVSAPTIKAKCFLGRMPSSATCMPLVNELESCKCTNTTKVHRKNIWIYFISPNGGVSQVQGWVVECYSIFQRSESVSLLSEDNYVEALTEAYKSAASWDTRQQVLSVMSRTIAEHIPGLTQYRYTICKPTPPEVWPNCTCPASICPATAYW